MELFAQLGTPQVTNRCSPSQALAHVRPPLADIDNQLLDKDDGVHAILKTSKNQHGEHSNSRTTFRFGKMAP
ncbi:hypothetical protein XH97_02855 [Bradyrhizobium sp. CCBAU 53380]|nr:hypothetical protein [Bradyrhizobium sp. CCBAU 53380]